VLQAFPYLTPLHLSSSLFSSWRIMTLIHHVVHH
jgi:hypothetical protein